MALYRLDELEGQPIGHFNGTCIDDQDITIDNYEFTTDYLENATSGEKVVKDACQPPAEIKLPDHPSTRFGFDSNSVSWTPKLTEKNRCVTWSHSVIMPTSSTNGAWNASLMTCYASASQRNKRLRRYTRRGGLDINPWRSNSDFVPSTTRLVRQ